MSTLPLPRFTVAEYLEMERASESRSEYLQGLIVAMSGGSLNHARIAAALSAELLLQLRGSHCEVTGSDTRLRIASYNVFTYPDVVVNCGPDQFLDAEKDTLLDATFICEVLSPTTKNYDRGEKFRYYRALPSFSEFLLIAQDEIRAEHHRRQPDGSWLFHEHKDPDISIELSSIGCRLRLGDLYERVRF